MRRFPLCLLLAALLAVFFLPAARAATPNGTLSAGVYDYANDCPGELQDLPRVELSFNDASISGEMPGVIVGNRTLAPLRLLAEALEAQVEWLPDAAAQVRITRGADVIELTLGSAVAQVNGQPQELPDNVPAAIVSYEGQGYTMVPLRFFSETLGCRVGWDQGSYTASVFAPGYIDDLLEPLDTPVDPQHHLIVLDPGHGGTASGAFYEETAEKDLTLAMSFKLRDILGALGYNTVMTRETDVSMGLYERAEVANAVGADLFVSVHCNAAERSPTFQGLYVYHFPGSSSGEALARIIQATACGFTGAVDRDIDSANFVVLRETDMPAVLVETGFMTCHEELVRLTDDAYQTRMAQGIAQGIIQYLNAQG